MSVLQDSQSILVCNHLSGLQGFSCSGHILVCESGNWIIQHQAKVLLTTELAPNDCTGKALITISVTIDLLSIYFVRGTMESPQVMNWWNEQLRQPELTGAGPFQSFLVFGWTVSCLKSHALRVVFKEPRQGHERPLLVAVLKGPGANVSPAKSLCSFQNYSWADSFLVYWITSWG